jgi:hypothetical protein
MDADPGGVLPGGPWTTLDDHLLYTCYLVQQLTAGELRNRPPVPTSLRLDPGELSLAVGPAARATWRAVGDGSYRHSSTLAFGSTAFVVGSLAASSLGNASRRRQAAADAQPRWVPEGPGEVTVTDRRAHFAHPVSWLSLVWDGLETIDLDGPDVFRCSFHNTHDGGYLTVQLHTLWASLVFALAAHAAFPAHPRLLAGTWLPPDFEARCAATGRACPQVR